MGGGRGGRGHLKNHTYKRGLIREGGNSDFYLQSYACGIENSISHLLHTKLHIFFSYVQIS